MFSVAFFLCFPTILRAYPTWITGTYTPDGRLLYISTTNTTKSSPSEDENEFQKSIHLSAALACMVLLIFHYIHIKESGYTLSRSAHRSTDCRMWIAMFFISIIWTIFIFLSAYLNGWDDKVCKPEHHDIFVCLGRMAFVPWVTLITSSWWMVEVTTTWLISISSCITADEHPNDPKMCGRVWFKKNPWGRGRVMLMITLVSGALLTGVVGAWKSQFHTLALLNVAALIIYIHALWDDDYHLDLPHKSTLDDVRIPIWAPFEYCMVYTLPSRKSRGALESRLSRKIKSEHQTLHDNQDLFGPFPARADWTLGACRAAVRKVVLARLESLIIDDSQNKELNHLAQWLYNPGRPAEDKLLLEGAGCGNDPTSWWIPGSSLIGRDVVMALLHWESIIFERRWQLGDGVYKEVWKLRSKVYCAAMYNEGEDTVVGQSPGLAGFKDAVEFAFRVILQVDHDLVYNRNDLVENDPLWKLAKDPNQDPLPMDRYRPTYVKLGKPPDGMNTDTAWYVGALWDECWRADPSTFGALFLFLQVLYMDFQDCKKFHLAPLQPRIQNYTTEWRLRWRHAWYTSIICQVVIMLPTIVNSFFTIVNFI